MDRRRLSRKAQAEQRRELVLDRLTGVFAKRGYQAATIDHLIAGGKISMGGFYGEFEGKEDCFLQVYERVIDAVRAGLRETIPESADWPTAAALGIRFVLEFTAEKPMAARVVLLEAQTAGELAVRRHGESVAAVAAFLRQGREASGTSVALPENFEEATASGLVWLLQSRLAHGDLVDAPELWPYMAKMVIEPYLGAARADQTIRASS